VTYLKYNFKSTISERKLVSWTLKQKNSAMQKVQNISARQKENALKTNYRPEENIKIFDKGSISKMQGTAVKFGKKKLIIKTTVTTWPKSWTPHQITI
jgi:hypothetical protein